MDRLLKWNEFKLFEQVYLDKEDPKGNQISEQAFKKMRLCCFDIMGKYPFFRKLLSDLTIRENRYLKYRTMATDGFSIHYDPGFIMAKNEKEIMWVICHEIMHNVLFHFARKMPDGDLWNAAGDYAINQILEDIGGMPPEALIPGCGWHPDDKNFRNLSAEQIYAILIKGGSKQPETPQQTTQMPDEVLQVGDIIRDTKTGNYGRIKSIDPTTGEADYDIIKKEDVSKYL